MMGVNYKTLLASLLALKTVHAQTCGPTDGDEPLAAQVGIYSDSACTQLLTNACYYVENITYSSGGWSCGPALTAGTTVQYAMMLDAAYGANVQVDYTANQACPPDGPGGVDATVVDNNSCVQISVTNSEAGVTIYPVGGAPIAGPSQPIGKKSKTNQNASKPQIRGATRTRNNKRSTVSCAAFTPTASQLSSSNSVQISAIVDCIGSPSPCEISLSQSDTQTQTSSYSASAGVDIAGISASVTFGQSYSDSETTGTTETLYVPVGQQGFASAYCAAEQFSGTYTGCSGSAVSMDGTILALKSNGFTYEVVNTGA